MVSIQRSVKYCLYKRYCKDIVSFSYTSQKSKLVFKPDTQELMELWIIRKNYVFKS